MQRTQHAGWTRYQWAGDQVDRPTPLHGTDETAAWAFPQWAGQDGGQGRTANTRIDAAGDPEVASGFSGFGVSDSGGQRWAPAASNATLGHEPNAIDGRSSGTAARAA